MPADVIVLGAGGHARVVIDALRRSGTTVLGICDPTLAAGSEGPLGLPCLGGDEALGKYDRTRVLLANGVGSVGDPTLRMAVHERLTAAGWQFSILIHPSAVIGEDCTIEPGAQVMAGAVIQSGAKIGRNAIINTRASVDHDCRIGDHVHVAPGAVLCGGVSVGTASHIGSGAVVVQGIVIGTKVLIGAGVVVTRSVADGSRITLRNPGTAAAKTADRPSTPEKTS